MLVCHSGDSSTEDVCSRGTDEAGRGSFARVRDAPTGRGPGNLEKAYCRL